MACLAYPGGIIAACPMPTAMTSHYTHIEAEQYRPATEAVAKLVEGPS
jgi:hypothetical protein